MIVQSIHSAGTLADMAFTVEKPDLKKAMEIAKKVGKELKAEEVISDPNVCKVSLVGIGMVSQPGTASKMFDALAKEKINIEMISTSEIKISCVIKEDEGKKAVQLLHKTFGLDKIPQ
ncbi:MAG: ACT domain-containing protein, partial [Candidatus Margulisiibacteriota bacterium]